VERKFHAPIQLCKPYRPRGYTSAENHEHYTRKLLQRHLKAKKYKRRQEANGRLFEENLSDKTLDDIIMDHFPSMHLVAHATRCGLTALLSAWFFLLSFRRFKGGWYICQESISSSLVLLAFCLILLNSIVYFDGTQQPSYLWYSHLLAALLGALWALPVLATTCVFVLLIHVAT
jgi:hypothetical protein